MIVGVAMNKQPLNYESNWKRKRGPLWLVFFAAVAYGVGRFFCLGRPFGEVFAIMESITFLVAGIAAVVCGIRYGTQDKDYWP